jgi:protein O-GlcNAc transferase
LIDAVERAPLDAGAWHKLALEMLSARRPTDALAPAFNAVHLAPLSAEYRLALGWVQTSLGDLASAIAQYELAMQLTPDDPQVLNSLALACRRVGLVEAAAQLYGRVLAATPTDTVAGEGLVAARAYRPAEMSATTREQVRELLREGETLVAQGRRTEALRAYAQCAQIVPYSPRVYYWIGAVLQDFGRLEAALACYDLASRIDTGFFEAAKHAGKVAAGLGLKDRATRHLVHAQRLHADPGLSLQSGLLTDAIHDSVAHIAETRQQFSAALDRFLEQPTQIVDPLHSVVIPSFYLAYHGVCNRDLHMKLARVFRAATPDLDWTAPQCRAPRARAGRIKVGFISQFLHNHSIGKTTRGLVAELSRDRFEVYVVNIPPVLLDETASWIKDRADHSITLPEDLIQARSQIAALELDILFYQDIGLEPFSYFLAFARLAPVQCVTFGHPDTSGIPNMDYYISSDLWETEQSDHHYSERLVRLRDVPVLAYYYRPERRTPGRTRAQLGLKDEEHVYLCPQTLFKLHPDFDRLMAGILERDAQGRVLLIATHCSHCSDWSMRLQQRFGRHMPHVSDRIQFIPPFELEGFLQLLSVVDVMLDTVHFNGFNTSLEAFSVGTPVVTLPGQLQRARHTQAMYRRMGIDGCVAADEQEYIDIAVGLGTDADRRRALRELILERNHVLFEDRRVITELEGFFERAHREAMQAS